MNQKPKKSILELLVISDHQNEFYQYQGCPRITTNHGQNNIILV